MRKLIACLLFLTFINVVFIQAEFKFEITQEFKKGEGEITILGKTADEVLSGVVRTLFRLKCKIVEKDEEFGLIVAQRKKVNDIYDDEGKVVSSEEYVSDKWEIMIESVGEKVIVVCSYEGEGAGFWGSKKKSFESFCEKLKSILER